MINVNVIYIFILAIRIYNINPFLGICIHRLWLCLHQSPPLTLGGTVPKNSVELDISGMTFDAWMTFEKHLHSVIWAASQRLGILSKSGLVFHDQSLLVRCFRVFFLSVLWCGNALYCLSDTRCRSLDRVVNGASFLAGGVLECNLTHRRSVAVLYMLYTIKINPVNPLCGVLLVPFVPVRVTHSALVDHHHPYTSLSSNTSLQLN